MGKMELEFHEAADLFPLMDRDELQALADDIARNGLEEAIALCDDRILDGRNRYLACQLAGVEPDWCTVEPKDPVAYVISMNLHRRHLNESQRAMVGARARKHYDDAAKERQKLSKGRGQKGPDNLPDLKTGDARDEAGAAVSVSGKSVDHASKVLEAVPALAEVVDRGTLSVSVAAKVAELPKPEQNKIAKADDPKALARELLAGMKTPHQLADEDPERRWSASLHKIYVLLNSTRDLGGVKKLIAKWTSKGKREYVAELKRIIGELDTWVKALEKTK